MSLVGVQFAGLNKFEQALKNLQKSAQESAKRRATLAAFMIEGTAKKLIQQTSSGQQVIRYRGGSKRTHTASKAGDAPNTDTGRLIGSIRTRFSKSESAAFVFTKLDYAFWLEFGTSQMKARPFLRPALKAYLQKSKNQGWSL